MAPTFRPIRVGTNFLIPEVRDNPSQKLVPTPSGLEVDANPQWIRSSYQPQWSEVGANPRSSRQPLRKESSKKERLGGARAEKHALPKTRGGIFLLGFRQEEYLALYTGGCALFAGGVGYAVCYSVCWTLWTVGSVCWRCWTRCVVFCMLEAMHRMLLCMLKAVDSGLGLLEALVMLEFLELLEAMRRVLL